MKQNSNIIMIKANENIKQSQTNGRKKTCKAQPAFIYGFKDAFSFPSEKKSYVPQPKD